MSGWEAHKNFYDPMCGSGTFLIEAAMLALNIPSGMFRKGFGFQRWKNYEEELWNKILAKSKSEVKNNLDIQICGADVTRDHFATINTNGNFGGKENITRFVWQLIDCFSYGQAGIHGPV